MAIRETVRSGRRENFYITENNFIDHYAKEMQPVDVAVYHALERYANCHTRSTWVGTAKIAEVLNVSQRTVQRSLKALADLKLIRTVQTATLKTHFIVPVPPRPKTNITPLFDGLSEDHFVMHDTDVATATVMSESSPYLSREASSVTRETTVTSPYGDIADTLYKEEQDSINNTKEQNLFNKVKNESNHEMHSAAKRIVTILKLPASAMSAAIAAVEERKKSTRLSEDGIVNEIVTDANRALRRGVDADEFLGDFLAQQLARKILKELNLPVTVNYISTVAASIKAETSHSGSSMEKVTEFIVEAAIENVRSGIAIDKFYFENVRWRNNGRTGKGQKQFDRIKRARDEAHAIIDAQMDN